MLRTVSIRNFRSCNDVRIDFDPNLLALVGPNGVGKTNIMQAIAWVANIITTPEPIDITAYGSPRKGFEFECEIELDSGDYRYRLSLENSGEDFFEFVLREELIRLGELGDRIFIRKDSHIEWGPNQSAEIAEKTSALAVLSSLLSKREREKLGLLSLAEFFRGIGYYTFNDKESKPKNYVTPSEYETWKSGALSGASGSAASLMKLLHMSKEAPETFEDVKSILGTAGLDLLKDIKIREISSQMDFDSSKDSSENSENELAFYMLLCHPSDRLAGSGRQFTLRSLSAGTRKIIDIVVSLYFDKRALMLIEQPEDAIHSGLLRKLIDLFRSYSDHVQFIVATHSNSVLNILEPNEIRLVCVKGGLTLVRGLSSVEKDAAQSYLEEKGSLAEFIEAVQD